MYETVFFNLGFDPAPGRAGCVAVSGGAVPGDAPWANSDAPWANSDTELVASLVNAHASLSEAANVISGRHGQLVSCQEEPDPDRLHTARQRLAAAEAAIRCAAAKVEEARGTVEEMLRHGDGAQRVVTAPGRPKRMFGTSNSVLSGALDGGASPSPMWTNAVISAYRAVC